MGATWVLSVPDGPHVGPMNLAIRGYLRYLITHIMYMPNYTCPKDIGEVILMDVGKPRYQTTIKHNRVKRVYVFRVCIVTVGLCNFEISLRDVPCTTRITYMVRVRCCLKHDDVIKWKHFPRYWPFVRGIHRSPVNSPHKGQWRGAWKFSLICGWINGWANNCEAGDLRRYRAHYDIFVMEWIYHTNPLVYDYITSMSLSNWLTVKP